MAAYELARAGVRVLLLERESLPRYKACGGGLTAKTVREVPFDLSPVVEDLCHGFAVTFRQAGQFARRYHRPMVYAATAPNPIARSNHVFKVHIGGSQ